jgi:glycosyltransferase involved in cell wall biosynthesis
MKKISYISALLDNSGYAEAARNNVAAMLEVGLNVECIPISFESFKGDMGDLGNKIKALSVQKSTADIQIIHTTPPVFKKYMNPNKYNIGYTVWETEHLPVDWVSEINKLQECWVPSNDNIEIFKRSGVTIPVYKIPHCFNLNTGLKNPMKFQNLQEDDYAFYSIFQWTMRKNPIALLKAYLSEFKSHEKVALIIKTYLINPNSQEEKDKLKQMVLDIKSRLYLKDYPKILLISELLSREQMYQLHQRGNCYLSFSCQEGFGVPQAEAMLFGNPVIGTNYGGVTDFLKEETGYPVSYQLTPVFGMPWENYKGSDNWADINIIEAKQKMRYCFEHQKEAKEKGEQGRAYLEKYFSYQYVGNLIKERIETL